MRTQRWIVGAAACLVAVTSWTSCASDPPPRRPVRTPPTRPEPERPAPEPERPAPERPAPEPEPATPAPVDSATPAPVDSTPVAPEPGAPDLAAIDSATPPDLAAVDSATLPDLAAIDSATLPGVAAVDSATPPDLAAIDSGLREAAPLPPPPPVARARFVELRSSLEEGRQTVLRVVLEVEGDGFLPVEARVAVTPQGGSARYGADWSFGVAELDSAVLVFPPGSVTGAELTCPLRAEVDHAVEGPETALIGLRPLAPEDPEALDWSADSAGFTLGLRDAQRASVAFVASHTEVREGQGPGRVGVRLTLPPGCSLERAVTVSVRDARHGTARAERDYRYASEALVFAAGSSDGDELAAEVQVLDDDEHEPEEGVVLELAAQRGPATSGEPTRCMLSLVDDDLPIVTFSGAGDPATVSSEVAVVVTLAVPGGGALHSPLAVRLVATAGTWSSELAASFPVGAGDGARTTVHVELPELADAKALTLSLPGESQTRLLLRPEPTPEPAPPTAAEVRERDLVSLAITTAFVAVILGALVLLLWQLRVLLQPPPPVVREDDDLFFGPGKQRTHDPSGQGLPGAFIQSRFRDPTARAENTEVDAFFDSLMETHDEETAPNLQQLEERANDSDEGAVGARELLAALQRQADDSDAARIELPRVVVVVQPLDPS